MSARPRLIPFDTVCRDMIRQIAPCAVDQRAAGQAIGAVLAADVIAPAHMPPQAVATVDGYAVHSEHLIGASPSLPLPLPADARRLSAGDRMPPDADAVLPVEDSLAENGLAALREVGPQQNVLPQAARARQGGILLPAGTRLDGRKLASLALAGIEHVCIRAPQIAVICFGGRRMVLGKACAALLPACGRRAVSQIEPDASALVQALEADRSDGIIIIGGLGEGAEDAVAAVLSAHTEVLAPGMAVVPGQRAMLAFAASKPILALPDAEEAIFALSLTLGRLMLARLSGERQPPAGPPNALTRKIAAPAGLTRLVFVKAGPDGVTPLGSQMMTIDGLATADGLVMVPAHSEGFAAASRVAILKTDQWPEPAIADR